MTLPKTLIIGGIKWSIVLDKKISGGEFSWVKHQIKIQHKYSDERRFGVLIHEITEAMLVNNTMRYHKGFYDTHNGDYLFVFNHDNFEIFTDELSGVLKQFMRIK